MFDVGFKDAVLTKPVAQLVTKPSWSAHVIVVVRLYVCRGTRRRGLRAATPRTGWLNVATIGPLTVEGVVIETEVGPVIMKQPVQTLCPPLSLLLNVTSLVSSGDALLEMSSVTRRFE